MQEHTVRVRKDRCHIGILSTPEVLVTSIGPGGIHAALCIAVQLHDTSAVRALGVPRLPLKMASQRERPEVSRAEVEASAGMGAELRVLVVRTRTRTHHFCT